MKKIETNFKIFEEKKKGSSKNIKPNQKSNKNKKNSNESFSEESESDKPNICKKYVKPDKKQIYKPKDLTPELSEESETEVIKTERILPKEFSEAGKISNSEIKTIRDLNESLKKYNTNKSQYFISDIKDLKKKAEEYKNPKILESLGAAAKIYRFRAVKGDGNCSYRSVAFLYLEQIFMNIKHLSDLKNKKTSRFFSNIFDLDFKVFINENREKNEGKKKALNKNFVETLKKYMVSKFNEIIIYRLKNKFMDKEEFSIFFVKEINENPIFDLAIIAMIRTMARNYFVKHNEIYKFFIEENKNLDKMIGELDLEGEHIIIKVISDLLEIKINIVEIEKELKNFEPLIPEIIDRNLEEIYLFYRAGHYECLCKYENNENREKKLKNPKEKENKTKLENMYCNECECIKSQCIKSRKCDHLICVDCINESNQATKKNIQCLVCGIDMMTMEEFLNNLTNK